MLSAVSEYSYLKAVARGKATEHLFLEKHVSKKEFVLELLFELESRDIEASQRRLKAEYDRIKKK